MNRLIHYFNDRKLIYLFTLSMLGLFYLILYLYHALIDAISYAAILCLVILIVYFCIDYFYYCKKTKILETNLQRDDMLLLDLPQSSSLLENDYQLIINALTSELNELKQKQQHQSQEMLDYFTMWVHQIKTPIFALRLLIQAQDPANSEMLLQVLKIEQYVDMAMHYMKLEQISADLQIRHDNLETIVQEVIKKQATFFIQKKLTLQLDEFHLDILSDAKWLSFVLEQILSNALKYTRTGGIHIYVQDETLYIEDSGIGIKAEDLPRIFEKGFTGHNGRQDKKASGLGLYLCARILKYLGHSIQITSKPNQGTTVMINFHVDDLQVE